MNEARFHIVLPIGLYHSNSEKKNVEYEDAFGEKDGAT
jgi:hypothetical protein